jgi:hypothetical protein
MSPERGFVAESLVASEIVYGDGAFLAVLLIVFVFVFVAYTDGDWFIGAGLLTALVSALFIVFSWHSLADYPLTYRDGDRPRSTTSGTSLYETWDLGSGASVNTTLTVDNASDAKSLTGTLDLDYGCPAARVDWRIYAADDLLASGTFREGEERDLKDVAVQLEHMPIIVRLTAARVDSADCETALSWRDPGFEGPGHGKFRFVFPLPEDNG